MRYGRSWVPGIVTATLLQRDCLLAEKLRLAANSVGKMQNYRGDNAINTRNRQAVVQGCKPRYPYFTRECVWALLGLTVSLASVRRECPRQVSVSQRQKRRQRRPVRSHPRFLSATPPALSRRLPSTASYQHLNLEPIVVLTTSEAACGICPLFSPPVIHFLILGVLASPSPQPATASSTATVYDCCHSTSLYPNLRHIIRVYCMHYDCQALQSAC